MSEEVPGAEVPVVPGEAYDASEDTGGHHKQPYERFEQERPAQQEETAEPQQPPPQPAAAGNGEAPRGVQKGTARSWNDAKGFGFIAPDAGGDDIFVHHSAISSEGYRCLTENEPLEYELIIADDGRLKAANVTGPSRGTLRGVWGNEVPTKGVVVKWRQDKGFGFIKPEGGDTDIFVHQSVIVSTGYRELGEGEEIEFTTQLENGRVKAKKVTGRGGKPLPGAERADGGPGGRGGGRDGPGMQGGRGGGGGGRGGGGYGGGGACGMAGGGGCYGGGGGVGCYGGGGQEAHYGGGGAPGGYPAAAGGYGPYGGAVGANAYAQFPNFPAAAAYGSMGGYPGYPMGPMGMMAAMPGMGGMGAAGGMPGAVGCGHMQGGVPPPGQEHAAGADDGGFGPMRGMRGGGASNRFNPYGRGAGGGMQGQGGYGAGYGGGGRTF